MNTPTHPRADRSAHPANPGTYSLPERKAPSHARATTVLRLAGHQLPQVRTHPGTVTPESSTSGYGLRSLTVTLGGGTLLYCMSRHVVEEIAGLFDRACEDMLAVPVATPQRTIGALHPDSDAGTQITTAVTFRDAPFLRHAILTGRDGLTEMVLTLGPLALVIHDRTALADLRAAWTYARDAARRHWARERVRSDWDHVT